MCRSTLRTTSRRTTPARTARPRPRRTSWSRALPGSMGADVEMSGEPRRWDVDRGRPRRLRLRSQVPTANPASNRDGRLAGADRETRVRARPRLDPSRDRRRDRRRPGRDAGRRPSLERGPGPLATARGRGRAPRNRGATDRRAARKQPGLQGIAAGPPPPPSPDGSPSRGAGRRAESRRSRPLG